MSIDSPVYLSVIVPCFNEEKAVPIFFNEAVKTIASLNIRFELIFIDDGSTDGTLNVLRKISDQKTMVHNISFSRNFGKEAAILAG
jgi:glycosyltransferase involved in cell wall biosynthesis